MSVPISLAGWGPREGAAAWSFAASGHGAAQGVAVATTYGVLAAAAVLPGLVVLVVGWCRRRHSAEAAALPARQRSGPSPSRTVRVPERPYTVLSCGMSLDGYIDSPSVSRLPLSNEADFDRVDAVRASCDAILVGAATVRNDNPRLLVRAAHRRPGPRRAGGSRPRRPR